MTTAIVLAYLIMIIGAAVGGVAVVWRMDRIEDMAAACTGEADSPSHSMIIRSVQGIGARVRAIESNPVLAINPLDHTAAVAGSAAHGGKIAEIAGRVAKLEETSDAYATAQGLRDAIAAIGELTDAFNGQGDAIVKIWARLNEHGQALTAIHDLMRRSESVEAHPRRELAAFFRSAADCIEGPEPDPGEAPR